MGGKSLQQLLIAGLAALGLLTAPAVAVAGTGTIGGYVWDTEDEGIAGVRVVAGPSGRAPTLEARTDEDGEYQITGVDAGAYDVAFLPDESTKYVPEWYGDALVQFLSEPVTVVEGSQVYASANLAEGSSVSGRVTDRSGAPAARVCVAAITFERNSGFVLPVGEATTDGAGNYSIERLTPGYYRLWFGPVEGAYGKCAGGARDSGYVAQWLDGKPDFFSSMPVKTSSDMERTGVDVQLDRAGSAAGGNETTAAPGKRCVVPKVRGMTPTAARKALKKAHCKAGKFTRQAHRKVKRGRVIATTPKAGTALPAGATVGLIVSKGR